MMMLNFEYEFLPTVTQLIETKDQEARIRSIFELSRGPLPKINAEWLRKYHRHLSSKLIFPFCARYNEETAEHVEPVQHAVEVFGLVDPNEVPNFEDTALLCRVIKGVREEEVPLVDLEVEENHPNFRLLEDYWYWIWNWRFDPRI
jgi:hypothetical protein